MKSVSKVLVVDDVEANRSSIQYIIDELDAELFFADSGYEAIRLVKEHQFSVILMDVYMPTMDGILTTKLIRDIPNANEVPIIMVTGLDPDGVLLLEGYSAGAIDYVRTPIEPTILFNKVKQFIDLDKHYKIAENERQRLLKTSNQLKTLLDSAGDGIMGVDAQGMVTFANPKAAAILNTEQGLLEDTPIEALFQSKQGNHLTWDKCQLSTFLSQEDGGRCNNEIWRRQGGEPFSVGYTSEPLLNSDREYIGSVIMLQDISQQKVIESELKYLACYDPMTKLMNRGYFNDTLEKAIARAKRNEVSLSILILDLDYFKYINDTHGHDAGDLLLQTVSDRLVSCVRKGDVVARLGGDEFGIILYDTKSIADIGPIVNKIIEFTSNDIDIKTSIINITCSIGVFQYDDFNLTMEASLKNADIALYEAKAMGRNNYKLFIPNMHNELIEKKRIQVLLHQSISNQEFSLTYQPKVSISRRVITGCETLLRWNQGYSKDIPPEKFIPIAEDSGQIHEIGQWVIENTFKQAQKWQALAPKDFIIAINVSTRQLRTDGFYQIFKTALDRYSIDPTTIELEINETSTVGYLDRVTDELRLLRALGVRICIDDFGSGNTSLRYLSQFPLDTVKIDRTFIKNIGINTKDEEIIRVILGIAQTMGFDVIAEGAESIDQIAFLLENTCDVVQGYYFSKPLPPHTMTELLKSDTCFPTEFEQLYKHTRLER